MVPNAALRHKMWRALNTDEVAEPNAFAVDAAIAAFTKGEAWLDELRAYILQNKKTAADFIGEYLPQIRLTPSEATYLMWLDCAEITDSAEELSKHIRKETGLFLSNGAVYGSGGERFLRMNVACPRSVLNDGLERLRRGITSYGLT